MPESPDSAGASQREQLRAAREAVGLTQAEAARLAGVDTQTIGRWERGERRPSRGDVALLISIYADREGKLSQPNVRRGASAVGEAEGGGADSSLPDQLRAMARGFEAEAKELEALEPEMDYIRQALYSPETVRLFGRGYRGEPASEEQQLTDFEAHIRMLRRWLKERVEFRRTSRR